MAPNMDNTFHIRIIGLYSDIMLQKAKGIAEALVSKHKDKFSDFEAVGMMEFEWSLYVEETKKKEGGDAWGFSDTCVVYNGNEFLGSGEYFVSWAKEKFDFEDFRPLPLLYAMAREEYKQFLMRNNHDFLFLDIAVDGKPLGRLILELFTSICPKTCENFKRLCIGDMQESTNHTPPLKLKYQGSIFHRIVKNGWIQGGDFEKGSGTGGESIYGPTFEDENFAVKHDRRGIFGMANKGRHTNGSQFYITLQPMPWMNTKYVAFGVVVAGSAVLNTLENQETYNERPVRECLITDCGELDKVLMSKVT